MGLNIGDMANAIGTTSAKVSKILNGKIHGGDKLVGLEYFLNEKWSEHLSRIGVKGRQGPLGTSIS